MMQVVYEHAPRQTWETPFASGRSRKKKQNVPNHHDEVMITEESKFYHILL